MGGARSRPETGTGLGQRRFSFHTVRLYSSLLSDFTPHYCCVEAPLEVFKQWTAKEKKGLASKQDQQASLKTNVLTDTLLGSIQCCRASAVVPLGRTTGSRRPMSKVTKQDGKHRDPATTKGGEEEEAESEKASFCMVFWGGLTNICPLVTAVLHRRELRRRRTRPLDPRAHAELCRPFTVLVTANFPLDTHREPSHGDTHYRCTAEEQHLHGVKTKANQIDTIILNLR